MKPKPRLKKPIQNKITYRKSKDDTNSKIGDSGYNTAEAIDKIDSVDACMKAALAVDKFRKIKIRKKQEKRLSLKSTNRAILKSLAPKPTTFQSVAMPFSNISSVFMKKKKSKNLKQEKITLKSLKESMEKRNRKKNEQKAN